MREEQLLDQRPWPLALLSRSQFGVLSGGWDLLVSAVTHAGRLLVLSCTLMRNSRSLRLLMVAVISGALCCCPVEAAAPLRELSTSTSDVVGCMQRVAPSQGKGQFAAGLCVALVAQLAITQACPTAHFACEGL